jgi:uncharacterized protein YbjQ (UPF0145 family)
LPPRTLPESPWSSPACAISVTSHHREVTTTGYVEGRKVEEYLGICAGEAISGAIIGLSLDYEVVSEKGSMLMVVASGTAVRLAG